MEEEKNEQIELEELIEEEGQEIQDLPDSPISDVPVPEIVEENVKLKTNGKPFNELTNYEKIKFAAAQNGVQIKKPNTTCNHCNGTGVISTKKVIEPTPLLSGATSADNDTSGLIEEIPNPCKCIFHKHDLPKMFTGKVPMTRKLERQGYKTDRKKLLKNSTSFKLEQERLARVKRAKKNKRKKLKKKFNKR